MSKPKTKGVLLQITMKQWEAVNKIRSETRIDKGQIYLSAFSIGLEAVKVEHEANKADGFRGVK